MWFNAVFHTNSEYAICSGSQLGCGHENSQIRTYFSHFYLILSPNEERTYFSQQYNKVKQNWMGTVIAHDLMIIILEDISVYLLL